MKDRGGESSEALSNKNTDTIFDIQYDNCLSMWDFRFRGFIGWNELQGLKWKKMITKTFLIIFNNLKLFKKTKTKRIK